MTKRPLATTQARQRRDDHIGEVVPADLHLVVLLAVDEHCVPASALRLIDNPQSCQGLLLEIPQCVLAVLQEVLVLGVGFFDKLLGAKVLLHVLFGEARDPFMLEGQPGSALGDIGLVRRDVHRDFEGLRIETEGAQLSVGLLLIVKPVTGHGLVAGPLHVGLGLVVHRV